MKESFTVWGEKTDLDALEISLKSNGFNPFEDNVIHASTGKRPRSVSWILVSGIGKVIKDFLRSRRQILITRETHGETLKITGDWTAEEIERTLIVSHGFNLKPENDPLPEQSPEPSNSEGEMGFHVGREKKPKK